MLVNILHFIKLPAFVKNPKTKKLYIRIERLGFKTPNTFFLTEESKNTQTTGPSARKAEISLFTVPNLDLSNDSHLAHSYRVPKRSKSFLPLLYSKKYRRNSNCVCPLLLERRHLNAYHMRFRMTHPW